MRQLTQIRSKRRKPTVVSKNDMGACITRSIASCDKKCVNSLDHGDKLMLTLCSCLDAKKVRNANIIPIKKKPRACEAPRPA